MKKIFLPLLLVLFSFNSYSQFKGNPGKAKSSLDKAALKTELNEKRDLIIIAKGEIDAAYDASSSKRLILINDAIKNLY